MERQVAWEKYTNQDIDMLEQLASDYIRFISANKTERECTHNSIELAKKAGYKSLQTFIDANSKLVPGDKVYAHAHGKALILVHIGNEPLEKGMNILGAHIDSPRLDIKQNPLYESHGFALLDTHYYGGIKKYQWVTIPLALHGVVVKKDGTKINVCVGEDDSDPVFFISDLLVHLSAEQMQKKASKVIDGEDLDIIVSNRPLHTDRSEKHSKDTNEPSDKDPVKANVLKILKEKYDIELEDFVSAELEVVPAGKAREAGFDRSMVVGYGQDDRVCAYTSLKAQLESDTSARTSVCILVDKEEIGSVGATGMASQFFENVIAEIMELAGEGGMLKLKRGLSASTMLSSDVSAGFDPAYASVFDEKNAAFLGKGLVFNKYTGSRGKSGSNDASAEYMALIRKIMDDANISYQTAELGKVDAGGGGTIAFLSAKYGMDVIDSGVALLSMHAPWEVASKADIYEAYKGYKAFLKDATTVMSVRE